MKNILIIYYLCIASMVYAQDTVSFGFSGSYGNFDAIGAEAYIKKQLRIAGLPMEMKLGANYRPYLLDIDEVKDLHAQSIGVFGDLVYYPFRNEGLFTGLRWEAINLNWLSQESMTRYKEHTDETVSSVYSGTCLFFQVGYQLKLGDVMRLRIYGQPGFQEYKVSSIGNTSFVDEGNSTRSPEQQFRFIYNVNAGIEFRIR